MEQVTLFVLLTLSYLFVISIILKKLGGREMLELEKEVKKLMEKAKKGDKDALSKMNKLNMTRMKTMMKKQLYLWPLILVFFWYIKKTFIELTVTIFGRQIGWLGTFFIIVLLFSTVADKLATRLLENFKLI
ncbi:MAG: hypothetical protein GOU99_01130 [Candidatus Altiarchaeota archaeon]|nr:hypothetical protein [Candidatus Altiarchaeota archaeon]